MSQWNCGDPEDQDGYPNWKNYTATYTHVDKAAIIEAMRKALQATTMKPPVNDKLRQMGMTESCLASARSAVSQFAAPAAGMLLEAIGFARQTLDVKEVELAKAGLVPSDELICFECGHKSPHRRTEQANELGRKFAARLMLLDRRKRFVVPSEDEWIGVNLLKRDDEL